MSRAKVWCAAALAAILAVPGAASAQIDEVADSMRAAGWRGVEAMPSDTLAFYGGVINRADFNNPAPQCDTVAMAFDEITAGFFYGGTSPGKDAEYFAVQTTEGLMSAIVLDRPIYGNHTLALESLLHEAAHHSEGNNGAGYGHTGTFTAQNAERCAVLKPTEDEDDPGGGGTVTTCTDEPYTYKEWDWVWTEIEAGSCVGVSPVALPGEEPGEPELHCTPATWGYVLMEVEKEGVRTVCVTTSN